ncbi:hypothetical protein DIPPA_19282 [Diplonema papillatum]|nr:hypothetical protein DIPPA_19282 [Diplonema papillatum]
MSVAGSPVQVATLDQSSGYVVHSGDEHWRSASGDAAYYSSGSDSLARMQRAARLASEASAVRTKAEGTGSLHRVLQAVPAYVLTDIPQQTSPPSPASAAYNRMSPAY